MSDLRPLDVTAFAEWLRAPSAEPLHEVRCALADVLDGADPSVLDGPLPAVYAEGVEPGGRWHRLQSTLGVWRAGDVSPFREAAGVLEDRVAALWADALDDLLA